MKKILFLSFILAFHLAPAQLKIAFGSCSKENKPQPILYSVVKQKPDLFVYLGDNIYGDTKLMFILRAKYRKLKRKKEFQALRDSVPIVATWDDHDYGENDSGKEYIRKKASKRIFLKFFREPKDSERRKHKGIYTSYYYKAGKDSVQLILLDNRTFRTKLTRTDEKRPDNMGPYVPDSSSNASMLGEEQWKWLDEQLKKPASFRIIGTSTQFIAEFNGHEAWANFPAEKKRLLNLIDENNVTNLAFITGDPHYAEISKMKTPKGTQLTEVTSSGITQVWYNTGPNKYRVGEGYLKQNFGTIEFDSLNNNVTFRIHGLSGEEILKDTVKLK